MILIGIVSLNGSREVRAQTDATSSTAAVPTAAPKATTTPTAPAPATAVLTTPKPADTPSATYAPNSLFSVDSKSTGTLTIQYATKPLLNGGGAFQLDGGTVADKTQVVIDADPSLLFLPTTVEISIMFQFADGVRKYPPIPVKISNVKWDAKKKQYIITTDMLKKVANDLASKIETTYIMGGFDADTPVPVPHSANLTLKPSVAANILEAAGFFVQEVPVTNAIPVVMRPADPEVLPLKAAVPAEVTPAK